MHLYFLKDKYNVKKLTVLVLRAFAGPLVITFPISIFVLLMIFLWKYVDDLVGKGLDWIIVTKLLSYASITFIPLALPLSLLLASLMTFGNLAEHFEITAIKSAGVSLQKMMRPLIIAVIGISLTAFYFSNYVLPVANLKMNALLYDVRQQKPALLIKEKLFYNGIDGFSIRVDKKLPDGQNLEHIMIYDHTSGRGNTKLIMAEKGRMAMSDDERFLLLTLYKGSSYEEQETRPGKSSRPLMRTEFDEELIRFDLSSFKLTRTNEQLFKDNFQMLNLRQLANAADSIENRIEKNHFDLYSLILKNLGIDSVSGNQSMQKFHSMDSLYKHDDIDRQKLTASTALYAAKNVKSFTENSLMDLEVKSRNLARHKIEWQRKFTLSFACLILFFIGAPLGAIIRKGGLGMPVVVSILFFIVFHVISIMGEKFAREGVIDPWKGMWLSAFILLPIGLFLTIKATSDSALFDKDAYIRVFQKFGKMHKKKSN